MKDKEQIECPNCTVYNDRTNEECWNCGEKLDADKSLGDY